MALAVEPTDPRAGSVVSVRLEGGTRVIGQSRAIASTPLTATLAVPAEVPAGTAFEVVWDGPADDGDYLAVVPVGTREVVWEGPGHAGDYLTIVPVGARDGAFHLTSTAQARDGSPARLTAPNEPGEYEVRYVLNQGRLMLIGVAIVVR